MQEPITHTVFWLLFTTSSPLNFSELDQCQYTQHIKKDLERLAVLARTYEVGTTRTDTNKKFHLISR